MAITVTATPGKQFAATETVTIPKLNQLGQPTFAITGTVQTADIADASVTAAKMVPGAWFYTSGVSYAGGKYTLTGYPATPTLATGLELWFLASNDNVGAVTIDATGVAKKLFKTKTEPLVNGDIRANQVVGMRYESTGDTGSGCWQMISQLGAIAGPYYDPAPTGTANAATLAIGPAPAAYADLAGKFVSFKQGAAANTGAMTAQVNALAAVPMKKFGNLDMAAGDAKAGQVVVMMYDGTNWQVQNAIAVGLTSGSEITVNGANRGLVIRNNVAAGKLDVSVTEIVLKTAAGQSVLRSGVAFTIDISAGFVGVNGYDVGFSVASWYYIYVIYASGQATAGLLSLNPTTPALPAAYAGGYYAMVGTVRALTGTTLSTMFQYGREVIIPPVTVFDAASNSGNKALTTSFANISGQDFTNFLTAISPIAVTVSGIFGSPASQGAFMDISGDPNGAGTVSIAVEVVNSNANALGFSECAPFRVVITNGVLYVRAFDTAIRNRLYVSGYSL